MFSTFVTMTPYDNMMLMEKDRCWEIKETDAHKQSNFKP